jgi:hypothetical protein
MVIVMKKMRFVSILSAIALLYFPAFNSVSVSAEHVPGDDSSSTTSLPAVMPAAHSAGSNSFLTIDDLPFTNIAWKQCQYSMQVYCYEQVTVISPDGTQIVKPSLPGPSKGTPVSNCHNNSMDITKLCSVDGSDWMEMQLGGDFTQAESTNTYRWKVRTGKIEPDILMLGDTQKSVVSGNDADGWIIEIWAQPTLKAYAGGCTFAACPSVATRSRYAIEGYARELGINASWPSVANESLRSALRGTYITTNGTSQSWAFAADTFSVTAVSPHFLPPDSTGKSEVTPGYVRVFLPETYITQDRGYENVSLVTPDRVKLTVSGANATAKVTKVDGGILVDTGVEHFSAPNPEMMILKAGTASVPAVVTKAPAATVSSLKKGKSKALSSIARTKASQKPKWSASGKCRISGSRVVALKKAGSCKVTLRVLNAKKKYVVKATKTFKVS